MKGDQRVMLTKRLLQEGLFRLLESKGIDDVGVSELCAESGINRATFYRHYTQPRDILADTRRGIIRDVRAIAEQTAAESNLALWLENLCRYFYEHRELLCLLFKTRTDDEFAETISGLFNGQFLSVLSKAFPDMDEDSLKLTVYGYAGGFYYILRQWLFEPFDKTPNEVAKVMCELFASERVNAELKRTF